MNFTRFDRKQIKSVLTYLVRMCAQDALELLPVLEVDSQDLSDSVWHCPGTFLRVYLQNWEQFWSILWVRQNPFRKQERPNNIDLAENFLHRLFDWIMRMRRKCLFCK